MKFYSDSFVKGKTGIINIYPHATNVQTPTTTNTEFRNIPHQTKNPNQFKNPNQSKIQIK